MIARLSALSGSILGLGLIVAAIMFVTFGGIYLAAVNYLGAWKEAMNECTETPPGSVYAKGTIFEVHRASSWLPYWDCVSTFKDRSVRHRSIHVWS